MPLFQDLASSDATLALLGVSREAEKLFRQVRRVRRARERAGPRERWHWNGSGSRSPWSLRGGACESRVKAL